MAILQERIFLSEDKKGAYLDALCRVPRDKAVPKSRAVLVLPGGGYHHLCPREGEPVARKFFGCGYNTFVLHYAVSTEVDCLVDEKSGAPKPFLEVLRAASEIRADAEKYHIDPESLVVVGFSAGGHLAACLATLWDNESLLRAAGVKKENVKPNAAILSYPLTYLDKKWCEAHSFAHLFDGFPDLDAALRLFSAPQNVKSDTCPCFLWHNADDRIVPFDHSLKMAQSLADNKVSFELHVFPEGDHGLSLATPEALKTPPCRETEHDSAWFGYARAFLDECIFGKDR